jgi:hypothetical protein
MRFFLNPTCKETTELLTKRDVVGLSWYETLRMKFHLAICRMCRHFERTSQLLRSAAKIQSEAADTILTSDARMRIRDNLDREIGD